MQKRRGSVRWSGVSVLLVILAVAAGAFWALAGGGPQTAAETPRNVIVMISDGAGFPAWRAASYYEHGRLGQQPYDAFPVRLGCTTYMLNYVDAEGRAIPARGADVPETAVAAVPQGYDPNRAWSQFDYVKGNNNYPGFTDSAAAATALFTGSKTTDGRLNVAWNGKQKLKTLPEIAEELGMSTGTISTVQASHATPAAFGAHHPDRDQYADIFNQMLASGLDVIIGCGHPEYDGDNRRVTPDDENDFRYVGGRETWKDLTDGEGAHGFTFIDSKQAVEALAAGARQPPEKLVGIARCRRTLQYERSRRPAGAEPAATPSGDPLNADVPDLAAMSRAALHVLKRNPRGFVLQIEGGAVDWANHRNNLPRMIEEQIDFNRAVRAVVDWVEENSNWSETLLIVTADHECGQLWGPGSGRGGEGEDGVFARVENRGQGKLPAAEYHSRGHTNALVPLWAVGAGSERFAELVDGTDARAGEQWGFSGEYVDNTDVFTVAREALSADDRQARGPAGAAAVGLVVLAGVCLFGRLRGGKGEDRLV